MTDTLARPSQLGRRGRGHSSFLGGLVCRAARCGKPFGLQSTPVIDDLPWLPVSALVTFGLCGLCWGGVSWCPMSDLPLCTQVSGTPQPPTPVSWSGGALSRLAHCRLFPSQAIHLHLLAKLSYSALCCLSSGYMAKGPDRERFFLKKEGKFICISWDQR